MCLSGLRIPTVHIQNDRGKGQGIVLLADASAIKDVSAQVLRLTSRCPGLRYHH